MAEFDWGNLQGKGRNLTGENNEKWSWGVKLAYLSLNGWFFTLFQALGFNNGGLELRKWWKSQRKGLYIAGNWPSYSRGTRLAHVMITKIALHELEQGVTNAKKIGMRYRKHDGKRDELSRTWDYRWRIRRREKGWIRSTLCYERGGRLANTMVKDLTQRECSLSFTNAKGKWPWTSSWETRKS